MISIDLLVGELSGLSRQDLDRWIANDWIRPDLTMGTFVFQDIDVARAELIRELRDDLGVNEDALPVVLMLLDQLYDLRRYLNQRDGGASLPGDQRPVDLSSETLGARGSHRDGRQPNAF